DPGTRPSVAALVRRFGVELAGDLVVDERARLFGTDGLSARVAYLNQDLVPDAPEVQARLPEAQTLRVVDAPGVRADYLATTAESAWADVDRRAGDGAAFRPGHDRRGPLPVATFTRVPAAGGREGRLVVIGDADFLTNAHLGVLGNRDLLLTAAELAGRADALAAVARVELAEGVRRTTALRAEHGWTDAAGRAWPDGAVTDLIAALGALRPLTTVDADPATPGDYGLGPGAPRLELAGADGRPFLALELGERNPAWT